MDRSKQPHKKTKPSRSLHSASEFGRPSKAPWALPDPKKDKLASDALEDALNTMKEDLKDIE